MEYIMRHGYDRNIPISATEEGLFNATAYGWVTIDLDHLVYLTSDGVAAILAGDRDG